MNKEYTYVDGKVVVRDENDQTTLMDYFDQLDEVLAQENLIERMEEIIQSLETEIAYLSRKNGKDFHSILPMAICGSGIVPPFVAGILTNGKPFTTQVETIFGPTSLSMLLTIVAATTFIPVCGLFDLGNYMWHRGSIKMENGTTSELDFLRAKLVAERKVLEELQRVKTRENECTEFRTVKVDTAKLSDLQNWLDMYFEVGYNVERYLRLYRQGRLDRKLEKYNCTAAEIQAAKEFLEEKGPSLVLAHKKPKKTTSSAK